MTSPRWFNKREVSCPTTLTVSVKLSAIRKYNLWKEFLRFRLIEAMIIARSGWSIDVQITLVSAESFVIRCTTE